jgi:hypothetical protein
MMLMQNYKPLPDNHKKFALSCNWCGDSECNCHYVDIWSKTDDDKRVHLFKTSHTSLYYDSYEPDLEDIREQVREVTSYYNFEFNLEGCFWNWEENNA